MAQGLRLCTSTSGHKGLNTGPKSSTCLAVWPKKRKKYNGLSHFKSNRGRARTVLSDVFCNVPHVHGRSMYTCKVQFRWNPSSPQGYKGLSASTFDSWFVFLPFELQSLIPAIVDDGHSFAIDLQGPLTTSSWQVCPNSLFVPTKDTQTNLVKILAFCFFVCLF